MKFRKKPKEIETSCGICCHKPKKWYKERLFIVGIFIIIALIISYFTPALKDFYDSFKLYALIMWLPVIVGFLIGGIIDYFIPKEYIEKYLSRHKKKQLYMQLCLDF